MKCVCVCVCIEAQVCIEIEEVYEKEKYLHMMSIEDHRAPFDGIKKDIKGRLKFYKADWSSGFSSGFR